MTTYLVYGFCRGDHKIRGYMFVDHAGPVVDASASPCVIAERTFPEFCFHASENVSVVVPDGDKNFLFTEPELYERFPEFDRRLKKRRRRRS